MILIPSDPAVTPYTEDLTPPARALDSIRVGQRQRADLRDFDVLAASVDREGLLQPITIVWDGVPCGPRRLAAMLQRRRKTANVWAWSGVSDELGQLLAEQDDNDLYKPLTQTEQAALRREPNTLLADDAARNQEAFRLTATGDSTRSDGGATVAPPSAANGKTRGQAAHMATGRNSHEAEAHRRTAAPRRRPRPTRCAPGRCGGGSVPLHRPRAKAQVTRCRHRGGTVDRYRITTMPVPHLARPGARRTVGASIVTVIPWQRLRPGGRVRPDHLTPIGELYETTTCATTIGEQGTRSAQPSGPPRPNPATRHLRTLPFSTGITMLRSAPPIITDLNPGPPATTASSPRPTGTRSKHSSGARQLPDPRPGELRRTCLTRAGDPTRVAVDNQEGRPMTIHTQQSVSGLIASEPELRYTAKDDAWFCARLGVAARRRAEDEFYASLAGELGA